MIDFDPKIHNKEIWEWFKMPIPEKDIIYYRRCFKKGKLCLLYYDNVSLSWPTILCQDDMLEWWPYPCYEEEALQRMLDIDESLSPSASSKSTTQ
jgi:hypothetical protein